jgi:ribonuclease HI
MSDAAPWIIHTDGGARGNPGPAAFAYTIDRPGDSSVEENGCLGDTTNNIAEYTAVIRALENAQKLGGRKLIVNSDSELIVNQMNGVYKVKHPGLQPLHQQAKELSRQFDQVAFRHIPRAQNKRADQLYNAALDTIRSPGDAARKTSAKKPSKATQTARAEAAREQALDCLRSAASAWARGDAYDPPPDAVWEQLWDILRQEGVVS